MKGIKKNITSETGRRKTAVARVHMRKGNGKIVVNHKLMEEYFSTPNQKEIAKAPLLLCGVGGCDFVVNVKGGGPEGQAVAVRLGISRALVKEDEDRRKILKEQGFLTRDPRKRERKKYGKPGARKSFQFSKR